MGFINICVMGKGQTSATYVTPCARLVVPYLYMNGGNSFRCYDIRQIYDIVSHHTFIELHSSIHGNRFSRYQRRNSLLYQKTQVTALSEDSSHCVIKRRKSLRLSFSIKVLLTYKCIYSKPFLSSCYAFLFFLATTSSFVGTVQNSASCFES